MLKPKYFKCPYCGKKVFYSIIDGVKKICILKHYRRQEGGLYAPIIPAYDEIITHDCEDDVVKD